MSDQACGCKFCSGGDIEKLREPYWYSGLETQGNLMKMKGFVFPEHLDNKLYTEIAWKAAAFVREEAQDIFDGKKNIGVNTFKTQHDYYREAILHAVFMRKAMS